MPQPAERRRGMTFSERRDGRAGAPLAFPKGVLTRAHAGIVQAGSSMPGLVFRAPGEGRIISLVGPHSAVPALPTIRQPS
jgi:hypothetical protein